MNQAQPKAPYSYDLFMGEGDGFKQIFIPQGYNFMSIINGSDNVIDAYQDHVTPQTSGSGRLLIQVPMFTSMTVPLYQDLRFTFIWKDGGMKGEKKIKVMFADTNLNMNGLLGSPSASGDVILKSDQVGLARKDQFPAALGSFGGLKTEIVGGGLDTSGLAKSSQFPASLGPSGGLKAEIVGGGTDVSGLAKSTQLPSALGTNGGVKTELVGTAATNLAPPKKLVNGTVQVYGTNAMNIALSPTPIRKILLIAMPSNTDLVYVGSDFSPSFPLVPGAAVEIEIDDLQKITVRGSGATYQDLAYLTTA